MPHASAPSQSSWPAHGVPLPPSSANGVHTGSASPLLGSGHTASAPAQNGPHTLARGSEIGTASAGHIPASGGGYDGSLGTSPVLELSASVGSVEVLDSLLDALLEVLDSLLEPPGSVLLVDSVAVPVVARPDVSPSLLSPPQATLATSIAAEIMRTFMPHRMLPRMKWLAHFDGACEPHNPGGWGGWGFAICDPAGTEQANGHGVLDKGPGMTNNVAEYTAALECVRRWIAMEIPEPLLIRGDSKLVIEQMSGRWQAKAGAYLVVHHALRKLLRDSSVSVAWEWVPRAENGRADDLSKHGLIERGVTIKVR